MPQANRTLSHLKALESESIEIFREVAASFERPVMMYSIGKDSSVLLHLARKAFFPSRIPFPLLHIDTTWKFQEMIAFRDRMAEEHGFELRVHTNPEGLAQQHQPVRPRLVALHRHHEDAGAAPGAERRRATTPRSAAPAATRRSRAPRSASSRTATPSTPGTPRTSGPSSGASSTPASRRARACASSRSATGPSSTSGPTSIPKSIEIVPLYFARTRPVVERSGTLIMVDDDRYPPRTPARRRAKRWSASAPSAATR